MDLSRLRKDPVTSRWVVISPDRGGLPGPDVPRRPAGLPPEACPFCPGREAEGAGGEIAAEREPGTAPGGPGWWVRVIPDRFPIFHIEGGVEKSAEGLYDSMNAVGAHELIIETPEHVSHWARFEGLQLERVLRSVRQRSLDLRNDARFRHLMWVKNHGLSGSVFQHQHSHVMASPFVPRVIEEELKGFGDYARWKERCVLCDIVKQECHDGRRVLFQEGSLLAFAPFASCFPYECWLVPMSHGHDYGAATPGTLRDLARVLRKVAAALERLLSDPPFTLTLHSSPLGEFAREEYHWHLEIVPHPPRLLGPEWGTGIFVNPVSPEVAAERLRGALE